MYSRHWAKTGLRGVGPLVILGACVWLLGHELPTGFLATLPQHIAGVSALQWCAAILCTCASFWAVAHYDGLAHKVLNTGVPQHAARISGAVGIALGQTLGFGLLSGALARWRMVEALSLPDALRLSAFVSVSFVLAWGVVTAAICVIFPAPAWTLPLALVVIATLPCAAALLFMYPTLRLWRFRVTLPSLPLAAGFLIWALADTVFAAAALFVLLPAGAVSFAALFPMFLLALGCGLISNTPGGVGPFELVLLTALPQTDPALLMSTLICYRIVCYAVPALIAACALLAPFKRAVHAPDRPGLSDIPTDIGEAAALRQNGGTLATCTATQLALWPTGQAVTLFGDAQRSDADATLRDLDRTAQAHGKCAVIYKCNRRLAFAARQAGWQVLHIADDARIPLATYTPDIPARRHLRRKLRAAAKSGITLRTGYIDPAMQRVDAAWQQAHGAARGGSMGRFCATYVATQWVGCAYHKGQLVAFVTAHRSDRAWTLDIMRHGPEMPDGTMHMLVQTAIRAAHSAGAQTFSLAATPACPDPSHALWRWAAVQIAARSGGPGLRQFKSSFAPVWSPRYAAAANVPALILGLADIARAIHRPMPLPAPNSNAIHNVDENYELASHRAA
ncbi:MAG: phosphatidylglycerol lysyltransferase domain-containing protein [Pseudomonadota bacterium]